MKKSINNRITSDKKGFTLVELLVVIAIIAILSTIGLTLFNGAQQNARDARRKSDIDAIAAALEAKRQPGVTYYAGIAATDFSNGVIPTDSYATQRYCIKTFTTIGGAQTAITSMPWTFAGDGTATAGNVCPTGFWTVNGATTFDTTRFPTSGSTILSWAVCALLENTTAAATPTGWTAGVYCKTSAQ